MKDVKHFLTAWKRELPILKASSFLQKIPSKFLNTLLNKTIQQLSTESPKTMRKLCLFTKFPCQEISRKSINTESSHTIKVNNKENSNTNQKQDKPVLMNQLKDWQLRQNNVIVYNIVETDFVNSNDTTSNLLSTFTQLLTDVYEVTYEKKDISSVYRLGK